MKTRIAAAIAAAMLAGAPLSAHAQGSYPSKPLRIIVGPGPDVLARMLGQKITDAWGQQVVVDQRPACGGIIAAESVAKANADGYTMLFSTGSYTINASLYPKLTYDFARDFEPVSLLALMPLILVTHPSVPVTSVNDLLKLARARPGELNCASAGTGTTAHLACEMLRSLGKVQTVHVPYKGIGPALTDVLGGQVQLTFINPQVGVPHIKTGKLRGLAVTSGRRSPAVPDLPPISESGIPDFAFDTWNGIHVPAGTPREVIARLNAELVKTVKVPEFRERMLSTLAAEPVGSTPEEFGKFVRADLARWAKVIKESGAKPE